MPTRHIRINMTSKLGAKARASPPAPPRKAAIATTRLMPKRSAAAPAVMAHQIPIMTGAVNISVYCMWLKPRSRERREASDGIKNQDQ